MSDKLFNFVILASQYFYLNYFKPKKDFILKQHSHFKLLITFKKRRGRAVYIIVFKAKNFFDIKTGFEKVLLENSKLRFIYHGTFNEVFSLNFSLLVGPETVLYMYI